jgi:hypothetical protein
MLVRTKEGFYEFNRYFPAVCNIYFLNHFYIGSDGVLGDCFRLQWEEFCVFFPGLKHHPEVSIGYEIEPSVFRLQSSERMICIAAFTA